ncbi:LAMI_0C00298g1_1 [Lachancea mirantina]|uniref:LAMI_0C00298g1_1 n=1 Tax=Lachancea mirantina TaxID=1230905 RepID=A0A1G4J043_9SACH|nr:LAMI_0C00298g1_1 [Lachancea mirantina]
MEPILSQGYGYGFALGIGAGFAFLMAVISKLLSTKLGQTQTSERFSTASRSVGSGLIASSTVSAWTWPATLLVSATWSYVYGVSGGWLYAVGGTIQITLFTMLAIQIKLHAPSAHTISETLRIRFGAVGHIVYLCYCVATNVVVSSLLLLGGSQGFAATTGMHSVAASFLLPLNVIAYTVLGGLNATFISDWVHTVIIYVVLIVSAYRVYCSSPLIGSPGKMWELLKEAEQLFPEAAGSSFLSFKSKDLILLTWSVMLGGLASVFGDPGYSQRAIASNSSSVFKGYIFGSICWCAIPFALGSSVGLACRALLGNRASVTYPNPLSSQEVNSCLPLIYGLASIFGKSGAAAGLLILFMSVTSATSAELIAFSSISTYDLYRAYIQPNATGRQLVRISHISVLVFGIFTAVLAVVFNYVGVTVSWLLSFTGILLNPEVPAVVLSLFWPRMTKWGLIFGTPLGTISGIVCWLGATYRYADGVVNKNTVMTTEATFIGNIVSLFSGAFFIILISLLKPEKGVSIAEIENKLILADDGEIELKSAVKLSDDEKKKLRSQSKICVFINLFVLLGVYIVLTCVLYGWGGDLSKGSFTAFMVVMLIWILIAALYIVFLPLWQGRKSIQIIMWSLMGKERQFKENGYISNSSESSLVNEVVNKTSELEKTDYIK